MQGLRVINLSGIYQSQDFFLRWPHQWLDLSDIPGTNCYCDAEAKEKIRARLEQEGSLECQLHFFDSGNYHYMSLFFLEQIQEDFVLLLMDNHPDLQAPSFGEVTSCGGWVREALMRLPHLKRVYLYGVEDVLLQEVLKEENYGDRLQLLRSWQALDENGEPLEESTESMSSFDARRLPWKLRCDLDEENPFWREELPLYLSLDKDLLQRGDAFCNWSQGVTRQEELEQILLDCQRRFHILGADVCGEISVLESSLGDDIGAQERNNELNEAIAELLLDE